MAKDQRLTQFNAALGEGNIAAIKKFLKSHNINDSLDQNNNTILHLAVQSSNVQLVEFVLSLKPDVNCVDHRGFTPLHMSVDNSSCEHNQYQIADLLLSNNASINEKNIYLQTPIHRAVQSVYTNNTGTELLELLLKWKISTNEKDDDGITALHAAAFNFKSRQIFLLLNYGADITIKNSAGETPLQYLLNDSSLDYFRDQKDAVRTTSFLSLLEVAMDKNNYFSLLPKEILYIISGYVYNAPYNVKYNAGYKIIETNNNLLSGLISYSDSEDLDDIDYGNDALLFT